MNLSSMIRSVNKKKKYSDSLEWSFDPIFANETTQVPWFPRSLYKEDISKVAPEANQT